MPLLNPFARVPVCGTIASYNATTPPPGPDQLPALMRLILTRSLTSAASSSANSLPTDRNSLPPCQTGFPPAGSVSREDVTHGLDHMVSAFIGMLEGRNFGKTLVKLAD